MVAAKWGGDVRSAGGEVGGVVFVGLPLRDGDAAGSAVAVESVIELRRLGLC